MSKEYLLLFNAITDAIVAPEALTQAMIEAQQKAEDLYIEND